MSARAPFECQNRQFTVTLKLLQSCLCKKYGLTYSEGRFRPLAEARRASERIIFRVVGDQLLPPIGFLNCTNCSELGRTRQLRGRKLGRSPSAAAPGTGDPPHPRSALLSVLERLTRGARGAEIVQTQEYACRTSVSTETCNA